MRTVDVMSLLQTLQMYLTPPPEEPDSEERGADLAFVMRPMLCVFARANYFRIFSEGAPLHLPDGGVYRGCGNPVFSFTPFPAEVGMMRSQK